MHRVLLVMDSEDLSSLLHKKLSENFEVKVCDADTAAETIDLYRPDVLILDLFLPGKDGFQILQHTNYDVPSIILLTLLLSPDILYRAGKLRINYVFLKPFNFSALLNIIDNHISRSST